MAERATWNSAHAQAVNERQVRWRKHRNSKKRTEIRFDVQLRSLSTAEQLISAYRNKKELHSAFS